MKKLMAELAVILSQADEAKRQELVDQLWRELHIIHWQKNPLTAVEVDENPWRFNLNLIVPKKAGGY